MRAAAADLRVERLPRLRPLHDPMDGGTDFLKEIVAETGNLLFVISHSRTKLASGRRQQAKFHLPSPAAMESMVSSPSSALI